MHIEFRKTYQTPSLQEPRFGFWHNLDENDRDFAKYIQIHFWFSFAIYWW
jgi:hypothetical protein